jgi:hypothetical protein
MLYLGVNVDANSNVLDETKFSRNLGSESG